ncbi:MAG: carbohydrate ABC transporter substrate-binding protein [Burkholderiales bacterium]|nr:MAG: carbohydrate ABC transporter substrate-binding protein [Betaproteobacteria bacterium]TAG78859.1 MAG: carbohydrate ABC transporter substrate-binding protein [Burkholderiales bacterium]
MRPAAAIATVVACALASLVTSHCKAQTAEVLHWWTSKGESAAVRELAEAYRKAGGTWVDTAIAGGDNARNTAITRMLGGKPPTVAQFNATQQFHEVVDEGLLSDIDAVAKAQNWDAILPEPLRAFIKRDGKYYAAPVNIHNPSWFWYSKAVLAKAGVTAEPANMTEFFAALDKVKASGAIALALGGQNWQEAILFNTVLHASGGAELYRRFYGQTDGAVALTPEFKRVLAEFKRLKSYVDKGSPNRDWNVAAGMIIANRAGFQVIGDYVKGEFLAANKVAGKDYGCFPGFGAKAPYMIDGDVFVFPKPPKSAAAETTKAQMLFATVVTSREVQVAFNLKKGSIPIRADVDMASADLCTQLGLSALKDPSRHLPAPEQLASAEKNAAIGDAITKFWNTNQSVDDAARAFAKAAAIRI